MCQTLEEAKHELSENSFAVELLKEQRAQNKRKDHTILAILFLWFATIVAFVLYIGSYDYASTTETVDIEATQTGSGVNTVVGGDYDYGSNG